MEDDSPILCWTRREELLVRIASYLPDESSSTKTLSLISRCSRYCYAMLMPRRCKRIDVFIVDMPSLLEFVLRHVDATYRCHTFEIVGKAEISIDPRSPRCHEALEQVLAYIGDKAGGLRSFSYTTPWNEPFPVPNGVWSALALSKNLEGLDSTIMLDRNPALLFVTHHRLWKLRLSIGVTDALGISEVSVLTGEQSLLAFLRRHSGLEALVLIFEHPARITNLGSLDLPDLDLFSLELKGYDEMIPQIPPECLYQLTFVANHPNIRSVALPYRGER